VAAALLERLAASGHRVGARKPIQSFESGVRTDADRLAAATGESPDTICPEEWSYPLALAPPMAADILGRSVPTTEALADWLARWPEDVDIGLIETLGGVRSPLSADGDSAALVRASAVDTVVSVASAGLGTINLVRLSVEALPDERVIIYLNRYDASVDLHRRNRDWLAADGFETVVNLNDLVAWAQATM
jgi:dethiobiotin synthetase